MNGTWRRFLEDQGAVIVDDRVQHFGAAVASSDTPPHDIIVDLSHMARLHVTGSDALSFLHRQFINDVRGLAHDRWQLNAYCTPKGRVIATFMLFHYRDGVMLVLPPAMRDAVVRRLSPYVLRDDVRFVDVSDEVSACGVAGSGAGQALADAMGGALPAALTVTTWNDVLVLGLPGPVPRFEIYGDPGALATVWRTLASCAAPASSVIWDVLNIRSGTPILYPQTTELFVPQMINLDLIGGLSLKKGCYPGQEIVARTQHRGQIKRRMYLAHAATDDVPPVGSSVHVSNAEPGTVVAAAHAVGESGVDMLIVLPIDAFEQQAVHLGDEYGTPVALRALPYPFATA